ncbi:bifunctional diguanylate cyclase/phosphodiesterase [Methylocapsa sp. S129]|uniref:putative bifunctional diguanylate cyclase/phosphodiesterase n=1 Tax=Methylocapsa sp. S129 TaxID=1641869 RepID=UPI00131BD2A9|nr:EAL domain-containing protein [Methylocapsa sp. S129]
MRRLKDVDRIFLLLVLVMIEFAAAAIYIPIQQVHVAAGIERASRFELAFVAQEAKVDLASFNRDIARYLGERTADRANSVRADYAALAERGKDFRHGDFGAFVADAATPQMAADFFDRTIASLEPLIPNIEDDANAAKAAALGEKLEPGVQSLAAQALAANGEIAARRQEQLRDQQFETVALNIGLLLTSCGLIAMLGRQNRFVRLMHEKQIEATKKYEFLANHDGLTGLPNRFHFRQMLAQALAKLGEPGREVALFSLDLDRFKTINDTLGHAAGDALLVCVAERLAAMTKEESGVFAARLGGDEFLMIVEGEAIGKRVIDITEATLHALSQPYLLEGRSIVVRASVGIAIAPRDGWNADEIVRRSDVALNRAKIGGRAVARLFDEEMDRENRERLALEIDLTEAIERDEFEPHYQPIVEFSTGEIIGVEALARWRHGRLGLASPGVFMAVAEETGLIAAIGRRMLDLACRDAFSMPEHIHVAVNLSPVQFLRGDIVETVERALARSGLAPSRLELEIAEGVMLADESKTFEVIGRLRALGVRIALDDFGTGYASLSHLRRYGFDKLKIDPCFIREIDRAPQGFEIVQSIVALGRALGMTIVAEGVETAEQSRMAWLAGCGYGQGFLYGRPMSAAELGNHCGWDDRRPTREIA